MASVGCLYGQTRRRPLVSGHAETQTKSTRREVTQWRSTVRVTRSRTRWATQQLVEATDVVSRSTRDIRSAGVAVVVDYIVRCSPVKVSAMLFPALCFWSVWNSRITIRLLSQLISILLELCSYPLRRTRSPILLAIVRNSFRNSYHERCTRHHPEHRWIASHPTTSLKPFLLFLLRRGCSFTTNNNS